MNVLFIPIYSMRSYETGEYSILKDGNFQLTMARILASDFDRVYVAVPTEASDFEEVLEKYGKGERVFFVQMKYGANAVATRDFFWVANADHMKSLEVNADLLITDITGYKGPLRVVFNFNITKLPELDRPYIDRFFESDLDSIERSVFTTVINPRQREYILEVRPDLIDKVIVNMKCAHDAFLPRFIDQNVPNKVIFWPFRISDRAYKFAEFIETFEAQRLYDQGYKVVVTDPNDTLGLITRPYLTVVKPTKIQYYEMLSARPTIVMLDDIDTVLHPGTVEFLWYGCPTITMASKLLADNPNEIRNLDDLSFRLEHLSYNEVDTTSFVYSSIPFEIDTFYNKDFVNVSSY